MPRGETRALVWKDGRILKPYTRSKNGRPVCQTVNLKINGKTNTERVHRLVLQAFVGQCPEGWDGCHNDGNPLNNSLSNLRWDTKAANIADSVRHGTKKDPPVRFGEAHHNTTLTAKQVEEIRDPPYVRGLFTALSKKYRVSGQTIRRIRDRVVWR